MRHEMFLGCDRCPAVSPRGADAHAVRAAARGWQRISDPGRTRRTGLLDLCPLCADDAAAGDGLHAGRIAQRPPGHSLESVLHITLDGRMSGCVLPGGTVLHPDTIIPAADAPTAGRCHLPGCRDWWNYQTPVHAVTDRSAS